MNFYDIEYLEAQAALNNYVKYFFIFGSLVVLVVVFSLYLRHRIQTKYRDLSILMLLLLLFLLGVQYSDYKQNQSRQSQSSQMVGFVEVVARDQRVDRKDVLVNSVQLTDGIIVKVNQQFYRVTLGTDSTYYTLENAYLFDNKIQLIRQNGGQ